MMQDGTAAQLLKLNEQFYQTFGDDFSATRRRLQPGVLRILDNLQGEENILDLGCGNGELARQLAQRAHRGMYTGMDFSACLLKIARQGQTNALFTFFQADLTTPGWDEMIPAGVIRPFDMVTAFAALHHIPGLPARKKLLEMIRRLLRPGGWFIHSEWQFMNSERLRNRIQPWESAGLTGAEVDPGDALLDWRSGGHGLRYVHHFSEEELKHLADSCGFVIRDSFLSDGQNGRLGLYQTWECL